MRASDCMIQTYTNKATATSEERTICTYEHDPSGVAVLVRGAHFSYCRPPSPPWRFDGSIARRSSACWGLPFTLAGVQSALPSSIVQRCLSDA